ncbi:MAG: hypothetical protein HYW26_01765 [Candidatus Aenigmarchaeota archaeon]|nr:hypothetical protein [Candidatus Aenigmarchaeota archaeon]
MDKKPKKLGFFTRIAMRFITKKSMHLTEVEADIKKVIEKIQEGVPKELLEMSRVHSKLYAHEHEQKLKEIKFLLMGITIGVLGSLISSLTSLYLIEKGYYMQTLIISGILFVLLFWFVLKEYLEKKSILDFYNDPLIFEMTSAAQAKVAMNKLRKRKI